MRRLVCVVTVLFVVAMVPQAIAAEAPPYDAHVACDVAGSSDAATGTYTVRWKIHEPNLDVLVSDASIGTPQSGGKVTVAISGDTSGVISNRIVGTFRDPDSGSVKPFDVTVPLVLEGDCGPHPVTGLPAEARYSTSVFLECPSPDLRIRYWTIEPANDPFSVYFVVKSATRGSSDGSGNTIIDFGRPLYPELTDNTLTGDIVLMAPPGTKTGTFETTLMMTDIAPCAAGPEVPLGCWDGPSKLAAHRSGLVDTSRGEWYLYDCRDSSFVSFFYGNPGDYPFMGDWDGDGIETPGMYRQSDGFVYLRNANTQGIADIRFYFGDPGDVPLAGDFNGDGKDTVSIYRPSNQTFYIINELGSNDGGLGAAEFSYVFGNPGDKPFVGDFDGDGVETVGLHRESTGLVYFRNSHSQGIADAQFIFGDPGDRLIAGDWTGNGVFTPALFRPSNTTMYLRYTNTQGNADFQFSAGLSPWVPVSGSWGP